MKAKIKDRCEHIKWLIIYLSAFQFSPKQVFTLQISMVKWFRGFVSVKNMRLLAQLLLNQWSNQGALQRSSFSTKSAPSQSVDQSQLSYSCIRDPLFWAKRNQITTAFETRIMESQTPTKSNYNYFWNKDNGELNTQHICLKKIHLSVAGQV